MKEGKKKREKNLNTKTTRRKGDLSRRKCRVDCLFCGFVRMEPVFHEILVETKLKDVKKDGKKTGEKKEVQVFERFTTATPVGYDMPELRFRVRELAREVALGRRRRAELVLERFPQVNTVRGEVMSMFPGVNAGFSTKEEGNTLFVIEKK